MRVYAMSDVAPDERSKTVRLLKSAKGAVPLVKPFADLCLYGSVLHAAVTQGDQSFMHQLVLIKFSVIFTKFLCAEFEIVASSSTS